MFSYIEIGDILNLSGNIDQPRIYSSPAILYRNLEIIRINIFFNYTN